MKIFNHTEHKKLWNWLADNPDKDITDSPFYGPMACDYAYDEEYGETYCTHCPLIGWDADFDGNHYIGDDPYRLGDCDYIRKCRSCPKCDRSEGLVLKYKDAKFTKDAAKVTNIARQIANLPVKEGVICDDLEMVKYSRTNYKLLYIAIWLVIIYMTYKLH